MKKLVGIAVLLVFVLLAGVTIPRFARLASRTGENSSAARPVPETAVRLVAGTTDTLSLAPDVVAKLGIRTAAAQGNKGGDRLELSGSLALDPGRLAIVRSRFAGEVVALGDLNPTHPRPIGVGDRVQRDQLLAVIWSRDLGEKKSELVNAISQQYLDEGTLKRLEKLYSDGAIPEATLRQAERSVEADRIAVTRVVRTLETWRVAASEVDTVRDEAERMRAGTARPSAELVQEWARVEVRSPLTGVVLEWNVAEGELIDSTENLFKIADLTRLRVLAFAYEEDLPRLDRLPPEQRRWRITIPADPNATPREGTFTQIGRIIDPTQHTALVTGWVDNANEQLRVGQFVSASVMLPATDSEVVIPASALIEEGARKWVFVQPEANVARYRRRQVSLSRRFPNSIAVRSKLPADRANHGAEPLRAGELVVISGAVELSAALKSLLGSLETNRHD